MLRDRKNQKGTIIDIPPSSFSSREVSELSIAGKCDNFHRPGPLHVHTHQHHTCQHEGNGTAVTIPIERTD